MSSPKPIAPKISQHYIDFVAEFSPEEKTQILEDARTGARFCECHITAKKLVQFGTTDVPLDPEEQADYRANRSLVESAPAFDRMKEDAREGRTFSNIVTEYTKEYDPKHPLKIIGGQHRFEAIQLALKEGVDRLHGVKVFLGLNTDQRLDVQLISNTNIAISEDLFDRMQETVQGPQLRDWCQEVGLLQKSQDFADHRDRRGPISVRVARTFITNYFLGQRIDAKEFENSDTTPLLCLSGEHDPAWEKLKKNGNLWKEKKLKEAAGEFCKLIQAQRGAFISRRPKPNSPWF